ncbi:methyltransferase [Arthrobacter nitrophenolicus]|uniref:Putative 4-hydroxy-4-methyl-2-oxoglutarate aldolase n=1 Tax=Arthrobacter nitrophenolicus TaxID=683150 RepID=A0A4R5Y654_9MICC|nr:methyltransferase [Arthrobacter nitrophenolicus]
MTVHSTEHNRADAATCLRFLAIPTANIGDAMERLGAVDSCIQSVWKGARLAGPAFTVWTRPGDNLAIHAALKEAQPGDVIVVAGGGDESRALLGELIGGRARAAGIAGFVVDGAIRDADGLAEYQVPVFARAVSPAGPYKDGPGRLGCPVSLGGVAVVPGDLIVADADGVVVVPQGAAADIAKRAEAIREGEAQKRQVIEQSFNVNA